MLRAYFPIPCDQQVAANTLTTLRLLSSDRVQRAVINSIGHAGRQVGSWPSSNVRQKQKYKTHTLPNLSPTMKKKIIIILLLAICETAYAQITVAWGDSLTAGAGGVSWTSQFSTLSGFTTINRGVGGNTSTQIADRFFLEPSLHDNFTVIWAGRNNYTSPSTVLGDIAAMVQALNDDNFLVLGIINGNYGGYESVGGTGYNFITSIDQSLSATYGSRFVDIRTILVNSGNGTEQDILDFNRDIVPSSLRSDDIHLNTLGYGIVAESVYIAYSAIPEPSTYAVLFGACALSFATIKRKRA